VGAARARFADRRGDAIVPEEGVMHLPDSPRFHVIEADKVRPRYGKLAARPIYVYLPEAAEADHRRRFPVIYCQDGQNIWDDPHGCFGHGGWYLNRICDELTRDGKMEPVILVGIPNSEERYREYTPRATFDDIYDHPYANFVCDVVKKSVEQKFPAKKGRDNVALLGSSLGGLVSLWMAHRLPETFSRVACLSGAFQVRDRRRQSFQEFLAKHEHQHVKVYLDAGTVDDGAALTRRVAATYRARGWRDGADLLYREEQGAAHNERFWRDRVWHALVFLFGRSARGGARRRENPV
jgi:enterochelin esterase-like enzyme